MKQTLNVFLRQNKIIIKGGWQSNLSGKENSRAFFLFAGRPLFLKKRKEGRMQNNKPVIFQGKKFTFMFYYADLRVYGNGSVRLMTEKDGKPFGYYEFNSKKSFKTVS